MANSNYVYKLARAGGRSLNATQTSYKRATNLCQSRLIRLSCVGILVKEVNFASHNCMPIRHLTNYHSKKHARIGEIHKAMNDLTNLT